MPEPLPKFDAPPVVETAMSVQFAPLAGLSTPLIGWFWKSYLPPLSENDKWEKAVEAARLGDAYERFGDKEVWGQFGFRMSMVPLAKRVQIIQSSNERMVQVQDSRFILNWRKQSGAYPSFATLSKEFWSLFPSLEKFAADASLGPVEQNQWELSYINHIPKGELWRSTSEWGKVIPRLSLPSGLVVEPTAGPVTVDWRFNFSEERGRLHVNLQHARLATAPSSEDFMQLTLTARGPIDREKGWDLKDSFALGHEAIVRTFTTMTSGEAHKFWKRRI